jgi:hypothetical protein
MNAAHKVWRRRVESAVQNRDRQSELNTRRTRCGAKEKVLKARYKSRDRRSEMNAAHKVRREGKKG